MQPFCSWVLICDSSNREGRVDSVDSAIREVLRMHAEEGRRVFAIHVFSSGAPTPNLCALSWSLEACV